MTVRLYQPTTGDRAAVRAIWNLAQPALNSIYQGGMAALPNNAAVIDAYASGLDNTTRLWLDNTSTVNGILTTRNSKLVNSTDEEATALLPRASISTTLFRTVCKELLLDWYQDAKARGVPILWGKFPSATPALIKKFIDDAIASGVGSTSTTLITGYLVWQGDPVKHLTLMQGLVP